MSAVDCQLVILVALSILMHYHSTSSGLIHYKAQMINNYFESEYQESNLVYTHDLTSHPLFLGDINAALNLEFIKAQAIKTVVTAAVGLDHVKYDQHIDHIVFPLLDIKSENIAKHFNQFYELAEVALSKGALLVHCAAGISRSATLVLAYLMKKNKWSFREAITYVRNSRPTICPNLGFERQLKQFEITLSRESNCSAMQKRNSKTSEERKHIHNQSPRKFRILPEISGIGKIQLRTKLVDVMPFDFDRKTSHRSRQLSREQEENNQFFGTRRITFKSKKTNSLVDKYQNAPNSQRDLGLDYLKGSLPIHHIEHSDVMVRKLNMEKKKVMTDRQLRIKPLRKVVEY